MRTTSFRELTLVELKLISLLRHTNRDKVVIGNTKLLHGAFKKKLPLEKHVCECVSEISHDSIVRVIKALGIKTIFMNVQQME